jgi:tetratricopeptide (TPR) repeat protein
MALIPVYTGLTIYRNYIYSDSIRLWSDTVKKAPNNDRAHNSLATAYLNAYDERKKNTDFLVIAEKEFKKTLEINDNNSIAHCNLSKVYLLKGMYQECITEAKRALKLSKSEYAQYNLGSAYKKTGRTDEALSAFLKGYEYNNRSSFILEALGDTYHELGDMENARKYYEKYIETNKRYENAHVKEKLDEIKSSSPVS